MSSGIMPAQATDEAQPIELACATRQRDVAGQARATAPVCATEEPDELPPMTAEAARRLAAILAPHLMAMRLVTAGTPYGACAGTDPAATSTAATSTAAAAQLPPASAATTIFIAGMLERLSA